MDGIRYCGVCREAKQAVIDWFPDALGHPRRKLVPVVCRCMREADERERRRIREREFRAALAELRARAGMMSWDPHRWSFEADSTPERAASQALRRYIERWDAMLRENMGVLLYGGKGTGKSFLAGCVVNALAERMVPTGFVSAPALVNGMQGRGFDHAELLNVLNRFKLLVLDDLGAERATSYGAEIIFSVVDGRYKAQLPLIVTTNLDLQEMKEEPELQRARIYDRVLELCPITIRVDGESRRPGAAEQRRALARDILRGVSA